MIQGTSNTRAGFGVLSLRTSIGLASLAPLETSPSRHPSAQYVLTEGFVK